MRNALVPIGSSHRETAGPSGHHRPSADFLAQLIATSTKAPQTRARRRAEPLEASAAYRALGHWPTAPGRTLSKSL